MSVEDVDQVATVHELPVAGAAAVPALPVAIARFLAAPSARQRPLADSTRHTYAKTLALLHTARRGDLPAPFTPTTSVAALDADGDKLLTWFRARYGTASANTWNTSRSTLRSACEYWADQGWLAAGVVDELELHGTVRGAPRVRRRGDIAALLDRRDLPLRDRTLWSLLYDSAARAHEVLALDVDELDLDNRRAQVHRKGGAADVIMWEPRTSVMLRRYLAGRRSGPVFLTDRKARRDLGLHDEDIAPDGRARLSYRRAEELFGTATGGWDLHDLRHSSLTHDAEDGMPVTLLMVKSGHQSLRSLTRYTRPSIEAVDRWRTENSTTRRRSRRRR